MRSLLKNDTETVTEDQWIEVAPEIRLLVLRRWRDSLQQLTARLEDGGMASVENTGTGSKATDPKAQTEEAVSDEIEGLRVKFSYATSAFVCMSESCGKVFWFPHVIRHGFWSHYRRSMDRVIEILQPLESDGQDLVKRLLKDLKLDPETATLDGLIEDQDEKNLLCTMCDERVAIYMNFNEMIGHFLGARRWFENATDAIRMSPDSCYPSRTAKSELPKIINDHDWISRDGLLVRQDDQQAKDALVKLQSDFRKEGLNDPLCDTKGIGRKDLESLTANSDRNQGLLK
ncbi:hypothetical protein FS837_006990 [Tulasnella sp. UAMH 9824]|nr:hypothetical protein FS837_006990 [Tulasnella sp. UAMH 9824]